MLRPALLEDIPAMHALRLAVRENRLSDPSRVTQADYARRLAKPGASWVAEVNGSIAGFAIADFPSRSVWALFVNPGFEGRGIGRSLLQQVTQSLEAGNNQATALQTINISTISSLMVVEGRRPVGLVHLHDLLRIGAA